MATPSVLCTSCGKQIPANDVMYTADARVVCNACSAKADLGATESRAAGNITKSAWTALACGLVCWVIDPFFLLDVGGILSAIYALTSMRRGNEQFTRYLSSGGRTQVWVCAIAGLVLVGIHLLLVMFVFAAVASQPHDRF